MNILHLAEALTFHEAYKRREKGENILVIKINENGYRYFTKEGQKIFNYYHDLIENKFNDNVAEYEENYKLLKALSNVIELQNNDEMINFLKYILNKIQ